MRMLMKIHCNHDLKEFLEVRMIGLRALRQIPHRPADDKDEGVIVEALNQYPEANLELAKKALKKYETHDLLYKRCLLDEKEVLTRYQEYQKDWKGLTKILMISRGFLKKIITNPGC